MDRLAAVLTAPLLPLWALAGRVHPRWRTHWRGRWGLEVPPVQPGAIWVHAASVGEVNAAWALVEHLPDPVLLTADTDTGVAQAERLAAGRASRPGRPRLAVGPKPVDHLFTLAPLWAEARPRLVVFVEGTFWPALAWRAHRAGVPVVRVSAKVGPRTRRLGPLLRAWWWPVDAVWARDPESARLLERVHRGPVRVGGDLKSSRPASGLPAHPLTWSGPFAVGASTRDGDEERLLAALAAVGEVDPRESHDAGDPQDPQPATPPRLRCLLAPRHPERFEVVARLLDAQGQRWVRRSELPDGRVPPDVDVVLLDSLGELAGCLVGARFVFVGGTFDPAIGGHAPWEAAAAGVPVVAGPEVHAQGDAFARVGASVGEDLAAAIRAVITPARLDDPADPADGAGRTPRVDPADPTFLAERVAAEVLALAGDPAPEAAPRPWASPLAAVYGAATLARDLAWDRGWLRAVAVGVPVISVGSTNARSPGRTSTVRALVGELSARGHVVGVALRGYRRTLRTREIRVSWEDPGADALGDEGALLAVAGAKVAAGPDRVEAARRLVAAGCTVVVLDDGLQHRRLHRDLEIAVVDARYPAARGLLPAGERRERDPVPRRADVVLVHHGGGHFGFPGEPVSRICAGWVRGDGGSGPPEGPVAALAGIGRPADFLGSLELPVARFLALPDHAPIDDALAERIESWAGGLPIVCTHKDAVRLPPGLRARAMWREVDLVLPEGLLSRLPPGLDGASRRATSRGPGEGSDEP